MNFFERIQNGWNAFMSRAPTHTYDSTYGSYYRPDRVHYTRGNEKTIVTPIYNRIAMDVAAINIRHCRLDENGRYMYDMKSGLNECLSLSANIDQTGRAFIQDAVASMLDEGCVALVPVDTSNNPINNNSYDIYSLRVGKIVEWKPTAVLVRV